MVALNYEFFCEVSRKLHFILLDGWVTNMFKLTAVSASYFLLPELNSCLLCQLYVIGTLEQHRREQEAQKSKATEQKRFFHLPLDPTTSYLHNYDGRWKICGMLKSLITNMVYHLQW
ncbi:hypothetical protein KP509_36G044200 [Ceratopteris richardii]|uniref:Uncharacterized protein n=1 Tax=Ceratopteris richardii TaxID=49495 RepID=A0A8T2QDW2_CERRI|nr:hypothetical protein KP509_36G044200 [Ceratopteris richardii]